MNANDQMLSANASNNLRRRLIKNHDHIAHMNNQLSLANVPSTMSPSMAKNAQRDRLTRALNVQKQRQQHDQQLHKQCQPTHYDQRIKRIVFNGTFPIDDPLSSRFDDFNEADEDAYAEYEDEYGDDDDEDDDDDDEEGGYDDYDDFDGDVVPVMEEMAREKRYYMKCGRVIDDNC